MERKRRKAAGIICSLFCVLAISICACGSKGDREAGAEASPGPTGDGPGEEGGASPGTTGGKAGEDESGTASGEEGSGTASDEEGEMIGDEGGTASGRTGSGTASDETGGMPGEDATASPDGAAGHMEVTFLDVGQGNAVLVECDGLYLLVDGGDREYSSFVVGYLKNEGVTELDYVIASHYDADHLNGIVGVLNAFPCDQVLAPEYVTDTKVYQSFCDVITKREIPLAYPAMGEEYQLGDAEFTIVCPDAYDYSQDNDNSIGIRLVYGENSFLICGDAGEEVEEVMAGSGLVIKSDVYLASHHGSSASSTPEFMRAVDPDVVVVSAGAKNSYGHPARRVLDEIMASGAALYRTDLQGTLTAYSDGKTITWNTGPTQDYRDGDEVAAGDVSGKSEDAEQNAENQEEMYILNQNSKKFHLPSCKSAEDIHAENRAEFAGSRQELIDAGYEPCRRCSP